MEGPPLGPGGEDITWPDQVAPRGRKAFSTRKIKPQTSNLHGIFGKTGGVPGRGSTQPVPGEENLLGGQPRRCLQVPVGLDGSPHFPKLILLWVLQVKLAQPPKNLAIGHFG